MNVTTKQERHVIITGREGYGYTQGKAYDRFRAQGFANGSDIDALVQRGELTYPVRGDEFVIMSAPGKKLGAKVEFEGQTYFVNDSKLQKRKDIAIVLSLSQLSMKDGVIEGNIVKVLDVPKKDGWYNVDAETAIPQAGRKSSDSYSKARYWQRRGGEQYIGSVIRGDRFGAVVKDEQNDRWISDRERVVSADYGPTYDFGVALHSAPPKKLIVERIISELGGDGRYYMFPGRPETEQPQAKLSKLQSLKRVLRR
jgi:hypothetical protein